MEESRTNQSPAQLQHTSGNALQDALTEEIRKASETDSSVSIALVDLDGFAKVNNEFGIDVGDMVLQLTTQELSEVSIQDKQLLKHNFRGGDEYVLIFPGAEKEDAFLALEHKRAAFAREHEVKVGDKTLRIPLTFSAAVATYPEDGTRPQDVLRKASDSLYRAKSIGRNRVCLAKEERMVTKTSYYTQAQLARLSQLAKREEVGEAVLLREALDALLREYGV